MRRLIVFCVACTALLFCCMPEGVGHCRPTYKVAIRAISPPFSFLATKDGEHGVRGFTVDEMVLIAKIIGANVEFIAINDMDKRRKELLNGTVDILAHDTQEAAIGMRASFIPVGVSLRNHLYVNPKCRSVTCLRDVEHKKVAAIEGSPYSRDVTFGDNVVWLTSPLEALTMINQGDMDVYVAPSERVADYLIDKYQLNNILKKGVVLGEVPLGIIVSGDKPELAEQVRAAYAKLREMGVDVQLRDKWFGKQVKSDDFQKFAKYAALASAVVGIVIVSIMVWNVALKRRVGQVTQDLFRTEQRYRDLIESSPDMIFLVNEAGDILHANERARTALLYPKHEEHKRLQQIMARDSVDETSVFLDKVFNDGCDKHELVMLDASSHPIEVEVAGRVIQGPVRTDHKELQACLFARNVTERNRMEEELIQSERLGIIGKMAASLAHEINNPLGVIQANAEDLMLEQDVSVDLKEGLQAIQRNAVRAGEITKGLLEAASPKPMSLQTLEVGALVHDALSLLGSQRKRSRVTVRVPGEPLYIRGDDRALQQVILNLVFNSLAVTDEGGLILVQACSDGLIENGSATVRIEVRDSGKGIERGNLLAIFEPFFTSRKGGFGLGLFITRRMVQRMDGEIFAESDPGRGTSMCLEFPASRQEEGSHA